jgi:hypothetical protein
MGRGRGWKSKSFFVALISGAKAPVFLRRVESELKLRPPKRHSMIGTGFARRSGSLRRAFEADPALRSG